MAYLSDSDIMAWNDRIPVETNLYIGARYSNMASQPTIVFSLRDSHMYPTNYDLNGQPKAREIGDPDFKYRFAFSIASNREEEFYSIFEKLAKESFDNHVLTANGTTVTLKLDRKIADEPTKTLHKVFDKEYMRLEYYFSGKLSSIMAYVCLLETSIEYFSMIWGYDEDGNEYNLLKYPIGNVVSPADDKSKDYLILDYKFIRNGAQFVVGYVACEMFADKNSPIVKYGPVKSFSEDKLVWSRNNRIDDILN
jgi:hypothetical protein